MSGRTIGLGLGILMLVSLAVWWGGFLETSGSDDPDRISNPNPPEWADSGIEKPVEDDQPLVAKRFDGTREDDPSMAGEDVGEASESGGYRLTGQVVSDRGPVAGARVDLCEDNSTVSSVSQIGRLRESVESGEKGEFRFEGLEPGLRMILRARHPEFTVGRATGIDAALPRSLHQIVRVTRGHTIRGRVMHKDGRPLEQVRVAAYDLQVQAYEPEDQLERTTHTGPDGAYELTGIAKGLKRVLASRVGLASVEKPMIQVPARQGEEKPVDFVLTDGLTISGIVTEEGTDRPIVRARVAARATQKQGSSVRIVSAETDEDGKFLIFGLHKGHHEIWAREESHLASSRQAVQAGASGLRIGLPVAGRLIGQVVDGKTGEPVKAFTLILTANPDIVIGSRGHRRVIKNAEGRFTFAGIQPMPRLHLVVRAPGYAETIHGPLKMDRGGVVDNVVVALDRGGTIRGQIADESGDGIAGVVVSASREPDMGAGAAGMLLLPLVKGQAASVRANTAVDGRYELTGLREGIWTIKVRHDLYATEKELQLTLAKNVTLDAELITLRRAGSIRGIVKSADGRPDGRARLTIKNIARPALRFDATTAADGTFDVSGIPAGDYVINVIQREGLVSLGDILQAAQSGASKVYTVLAGQALDVTL